jgi:hypothetical protein
MRRATCVLAVFLGLGALAALAGAQTPTPSLPPVAVPPLNVIVPNYNGVAVGEVASLEAGAYLARVEDGSATWFNPAGLARAETSSISGSAGVFQFGSVVPESLQTSGGSFQVVPAAVGFVVKHLLGREKWTGGFQITGTANWDQAVDAQREFTAPGSIERATYSSTSSVGGWIASAALGFTAGGKLHVGGSIDAQLTESSSGTYVSDQYRTAAGLNALLIEGRGTASAVHLRFTGGAQYDPSPTLRLAAVVRTPGIGLWSSGSYFQEGVSEIGASTTTASFFDASPAVTIRIPLEIKLGAAYVGRRAQVEADVLIYAGAGTYDGFQSGQPLTVLNDPGSGGPPTTQAFQLNPMVVDSRAVVNVAIGGLYKLTSNGVWKLHGGFSTDRTPVGPSDTRFTKVNMQTWTVGFSGSTRIVLGSFGVRYENGVTEDYTLRHLQNGEAIRTKIKVSNLGLVYSFAFRF